MERKAKRLRGHQLEMEKEKQNTLTKGNDQPSALADKLLNLWAHGSLSASAVQDLPLAKVATGVLTKGPVTETS